MEQQLSFSESEYRHKRHQTRKKKFLARMEQLVPFPGSLEVRRAISLSPGQVICPGLFIAAFLILLMKLHQPE